MAPVWAVVLVFSAMLSLSQASLNASSAESTATASGNTNDFVTAEPPGGTNDIVTPEPPGGTNDVVTATPGATNPASFKVLTPAPNAGTDGGTNDVIAPFILNCSPPKDGVESWYYGSISDGPHRCTHKLNTKGYWMMLNAYRTGGKQNVHWKYASDRSDPMCLKDWTYYYTDKQGKTTVKRIMNRLAISDNKTWCALPVYLPGGDRGKHWDYCREEEVRITDGANITPCDYTGR